MEAVRLDERDWSLSELVERVEAGESLELVRGGRAVARLVPTAGAREPAAPEPFDWDALRRLRESLPFQAEDAGTFLRRMRDDARY